ncbi:hypothetical protein [Okeania sp. SIO2B3]|uniref:hypothetical protein n=1 Tax=Okeania sp. SIO2B3 TaxID=2607784 RepID=UPI0013BFC2E7|nr:hypothetical protein [Okeania sp. SIO2B3]NET47145.1 hypothetical protein [Okeania sp. SIO2B3]
MGDVKIDGRKTKIRNQERQIKSISDSQDKGENEGDSGRIKYEPERAIGEVGSGVGRAAIHRIIGGILGLFREVMREASDYMDEHGERLEKRLVDHKHKKASFLEKSAALETEIARLLEQVEKLPEDPNEEEE